MMSESKVKYRSTTQQPVVIFSQSSLEAYLKSDKTKPAIQLTGGALSITPQDILELLHPELESLELRNLHPSAFHDHKNSLPLILCRLRELRKLKRLQLYGTLPLSKLSSILTTTCLSLSLTDISLKDLYFSKVEMLLLGKMLIMNRVLKFMSLAMIHCEAMEGISGVLVAFGSSAVKRLLIGMQQLNWLELFCLGKVTRVIHSLHENESRTINLADNLMPGEASNLQTSALKICLAAAESTNSRGLLVLANRLTGMAAEMNEVYCAKIFEDYDILN